MQTAMLDHLQVYRCTPHATNGAAPTVLRCEPCTRLNIVGLPDRCFSTDPSRAVSQLRKRVKNKQRIWKSYANEKHGAKEPSFAIGDYVHVKMPAVHGKLSPQFSVPKKIGKHWLTSYLLEEGHVGNASTLDVSRSSLWAVNKMISGTCAVMTWPPASNQSSSAPQPDISWVDGHENAYPWSFAAEGMQVSTSLSGFDAPIRNQQEKNTPKELRDFVRK